MATMVGIRDLKAQAPELVERAASGERIVITRYGKPRAQLEPVREEPAASPSGAPRTVDWEREKRSFERLPPRVLEAHRGRWVAVHGGKVVDVDADHDALFERTWRKLGGRTFFIGRVGAPPSLIDMPGFEVE